jgi:hypothetical protein
MNFVPAVGCVVRAEGVLDDATVHLALGLLTSVSKDEKTLPTEWTANG